jgi:hypothetical protein
MQTQIFIMQGLPIKKETKYCVLQKFYFTSLHLRSASYTCSVNGRSYLSKIILIIVSLNICDSGMLE